jgi:integrase
MPRKQTIERDGVEVCCGFRIRVRVRKTCTRYRVEIPTDGKRLRVQFPTLAEARNHCLDLANETKRLGISAHNLTDTDRQDAARAKTLLDGTGLSILDAVRHYLASRGRIADPKLLLPALIADYLDWMETTPVKLSARSPGPYRPDTITGARKTLEPLARDCASTPAAELDSATLRTWLDTHTGGPVTWDHRRRYISMLFRWATRPGGPLEGAPNPATDLHPPPRTRTLPAIFPPDTVRNIMHWLVDHAPDHIPYFAAGFFAGLRPEERRRTSWTAIDFDTGEILVTATASKTHTDRLVTMPENLIAWLSTYPRPRAHLGSSAAAATRCRAKLRTALQIDWPPDVARHCYATYHCALHGMDATAEQLGHTSTAILHRHYRGLARNRRPAATAYFAITP